MFLSNLKTFSIMTSQLKITRCRFVYFYHSHLIPSHCRTRGPRRRLFHCWANLGRLPSGIPAFVRLRDWTESIFNKILSVFNFSRKFLKGSVSLHYNIIQGISWKYCFQALEILKRSWLISFSSILPIFVIFANYMCKIKKPSTLQSFQQDSEAHS